MYFHCQTRLVETFRELFPQSFRFDGNRSLWFRLDDELPEEELSRCIAIALTYHRVKASLGS